MCGVTASLANIEVAEDRLRLELKAVKQNSFGSEYVAFQAIRDEVLVLAESALANAFRRVALDPVRGLVTLMSPIDTHETTSGDMDDFIRIVGEWPGWRRAKEIAFHPLAG